MNSNTNMNPNMNNMNFDPNNPMFMNMMMQNQFGNMGGFPMNMMNPGIFSNSNNN
jgi:hypothetical protein